MRKPKPRRTCGRRSKAESCPRRPRSWIVAQVGDNPNEKQRANYGLTKDQWKDGVCNSPHGASIDKDGNLVISEWTQFDHLHKFDRVK